MKAITLFAVIAQLAVAHGAVLEFYRPFVNGTDNVINLAEITFFDTRGVKVAIPATSFTTSSFSGSYPLTNVFDNNLNTFIHSIPTNGADQWIRVSFPDNSISNVMVINRVDNNQERVDNMKVTLTTGSVVSSVNFLSPTEQPTRDVFQFNISPSGILTRTFNSLSASLYVTPILPVPASAPQISLTMTVDNKYTLYMPSGMVIPGHNDWTVTKTFVEELKGDGPWVIGVDAVDTGVISGFFAAVKVNGKPFTATGDRHTKWALSTAVPTSNAWARDPSFDDSLWIKKFANPDCQAPEVAGQWGDMPAKMSKETGMNVSATWWPGCKTINNRVLFRLVIPSQKCMKPKHDLDVIITADNTWKMTLDGVSNIIPYGDWFTISVIRHKLVGNGPWVIGVEATDTGVVSGFFSGVKLDGKPYTATGTNSTLWAMTTTPPTSADWMLNPNFDDSKWTKNYVNPDCAELVTANSWGSSFGSQLKTISGGMDIGPTWSPGCKTIKNKVWFRLVIRAN